MGRLKDRVFACDICPAGSFHIQEILFSSLRFAQKQEITKVRCRVRNFCAGSLDCILVSVSEFPSGIMVSLTAQQKRACSLRQSAVSTLILSTSFCCVFLYIYLFFISHSSSVIFHLSLSLQSCGWWHWEGTGLEKIWKQKHKKEKQKASAKFFGLAENWSWKTDEVRIRLWLTDDNVAGEWGEIGSGKERRMGQRDYRLISSSSTERLKFHIFSQDLRTCLSPGQLFARRCLNDFKNI